LQHSNVQKVAENPLLLCVLPTITLLEVKKVDTFDVCYYSLFCFKSLLLFPSFPPQFHIRLFVATPPFSCSLFHGKAQKKDVHCIVVKEVLAKPKEKQKTIHA